MSCHECDEGHRLPESGPTPIPGRSATMGRHQPFRSAGSRPWHIPGCVEVLVMRPGLLDRFRLAQSIADRGPRDYAEVAPAIRALLLVRNGLEDHTTFDCFPRRGGGHTAGAQPILDRLNHHVGHHPKLRVTWSRFSERGQQRGQTERRQLTQMSRRRA